MKSYKQLTYEQRCQIYALKKTNNSQQAIANVIGVTQSAISRELKRNSGNRGYRFKQAQGLSDERRLRSTKALKMTEPLVLLINKKIKVRWSPEKISGWLDATKEIKLSLKLSIDIFGLIKDQVVSCIFT